MGRSTEALSSFVAELSYDVIPPHVVAHVKRLVLNQLAALLWGWHTGGGPQVASVMAALGGPGEAVLFGTNVRLPVPHAAAAHAALAFSTMSDDTHGRAQLHVGHATIPVVLAEAAASHSPGRSAVVAMVAAMEAGIRIADAVSPSQDPLRNSMAMGFWSDAKCTLPAAIAAARSTGLERSAIPHAIAIAASSSSGLLASAGYGPPPHLVAGGSEYAWEAGKAVWSGVLAARLAGAGMTAGPEPLEGERGWVRTFSGGGGDLGLLTRGLGEVFETTAVALKPHCTTHVIFSVIEAAGVLATTHALSVPEIEQVVVRGPEYVGKSLWRTDVRSFEDAVASAPFTIAANLLEPALRTYPDKLQRLLTDPRMAALLPKFVFETDPAITMASAQLPGSVQVRLSDGRVVEQAGAAITRGTYPEAPLDDQEIRDKFLAAAAYRLDPTQAHAVVEMVARFEDLTDVAVLADALRAATDD